MVQDQLHSIRKRLGGNRKSNSVRISWDVGEEDGGIGSEEKPVLKNIFCTEREIEDFVELVGIGFCSEVVDSVDILYEKKPIT